MSQKTKKKSRTSFGATAPPFIDYLKDILRRYPDGGQILKELIQNADDAKATEVIFIHDERSYATESLWTEELGKYQGPALYAYNNAAFTDDDWEGIQMAGRSVKRNDPNKVGRFGIGFNSVYHTTDVPGIFSSLHLGFMDPQEKIFGENKGGFQWSLDDPDDQQTLMSMQDQFQPFRDIVSLVSGQEWSEVVMDRQYFDGTIFRFPLRNEISEISDNLYNSNRVVELFDSFIADADLSLLFLKNVTSLSLIHIDVHGNVSNKFKVTSSLQPDTVLCSEENCSVKGSTMFKIINSDTQRETKWLLTTCTMKEATLEKLDTLAKKLSFFPQVDLAFPCDRKLDCGQSRLNCFLPLPNNESNKTGLPVHVNACFGLTDNRREIKWQEEDQQHDEHAVWNELLMKEVLPHAYLMIIQDAIRLAQQSLLPVPVVYDLWPDIAKTQHKEKWNAIVQKVLSHIFSEKVAILSLAKDEKSFIAPSQAVFPCNGPTPPEILAAIKQTLVSCGENLVTLPAHVAKAINQAFPNVSSLKHVTPAFVRDTLQRIGTYDIPKDNKVCLLEYVLSDGKYEELKDLQLLPLSDGSFRSFSDRDEDTTLIDSKIFPRTLLPMCKHLFIQEDLSQACINSLKALGAKNLYKVINIDANHVAEFTKRFLPQEWKYNRMELVTWDTSSNQHPPLEWLQEFWVFLSCHFKELSPFTGIPLIPVGTLSISHKVHLAPLKTDITYIFQTNKNAELPHQIAALLNKAGGTVVEEKIWLKHSDLDSYVLQPSPVNVLKVLVNLDCQRLITEVNAASQSVQDELKEYLSCLNSLSKCEKDLLLKMPVFRTMKGQCSAVQSKQAVLLISDFKVPVELPLPDSVVQCATEADRRLLQLLNIKLLSTAEAANLLIDCIEKRSCSKDDTVKIMTWILQHGSRLFSQNKVLKDRCKNLGFIDVKGQQKKVSCFFDPRIKSFSVIFEPDFFPPHKYTQTPQMLESLTDLGLINKEADLSPFAFLHAATLIDKMHLSSLTKAQERALVLLNMLDVTDLLSKFAHEQLQQLKMLKWVPCDKPGENKCQRSFYCPNETRDSIYKDIVGRVMPIVDNLSDKVSTRLGFKCPPPPEKVVENLLALASKTKQMSDPDKDAFFKKELHSIYRHMQDYMPDFEGILNVDMCWIWSQDQFVSPKDLILAYPHNLDLSSYIRKVSDEFLPYKELLQASGLKTLKSDEEIIGVLYSIQQNIMQRQSTASSSEVKVSVDILNWFWKERKEIQDDIPVPVLLEGGQHTLKPKSATVFCDLSKGALKEFGCNKDEIYIIHEEIPKATAEWLNIQFMSTYILDPELIGIEQCGQSEPITTRIKNILQEYDEDSDIFKELIQNAEDAGAQDCKFLVDFRVHQDAPESLIDPNMALCQGPCLWAFNNEQFRDEDWKNIIRVGAASKENQVEKIGKFGLGFNTVYHVTDIPSILSGSSLLILDPNVSHLKKHIKQKSNPGIKLDLSQQRHFLCFPGQFGPYEGIFDCNFSKQKPVQPYPGTLIKLPFRTAEEAFHSEISQNVYDKYNITTFQEHFTENSQTHLLFLKKISTLTLQRISNSGSTPPRDDEIETVFTVLKTTLSTTRVPEESFVTKQHQAERMLMNHDEKSKIIECDNVKIIQINNHHCDKTEVQHWLQYNCFGLDSALKMALEENQNAKFSLPIGGVAVPLQKNPKTGKLTSSQTHLVGQAFCFLPLSICTGLPVNVNGTFAVTSNRKGLWETGVKHDWNKALLQDPILTAYLTALLTLKKMSQDKQLDEYTYYTFWPDREKVSETFKPLVDAFYSAIAKQSNGLELFSDGEQWCSMENAIFLHESIKENKDIHALAEEICKKYVTKHKRVVPLPLWLRNNFRQAGLGHVLQDRTWTWEKLFQEVVFNNLTTIDPAIRDALVLHAIDLNTEEIDNLLVKFPCIPTTSGNLQYINKLVNPSGKVACLFEPEEGRLLGGTEKDFSSPKRIQRLLKLEMASDNLPLKDVSEKATTICQKWKTDRKKANEQIKCLLELIRHHMSDIDSNYWENLKKTEFLPAISPDVKKKEPVITLKRPTDVFTDKCTLLVNLIHPVLDHENLRVHNTDPVLKMLGTHDTPSPETVLQQLQEAYRQSKSIDKSMLHKIASECYKFLDEWLTDKGDPLVVSEIAESFPFILIGSTFVNVTCVAKGEQFEAKPYLHVLPHSFHRFEKLWESVGIAEKYTVSQCVTVLEELRSKYEHQPLTQHDLSMCLTILNKGIYEVKAETNDCLMPDENGVLQPTSAMFYNDSPWMPVEAGVTLCHQNVSRAMACHFGIKTTKHHSLETNISEDFAEAFSFEQHEELTRRIKNIISAYPSKKDILKELIQNADDAEATEIHFVWDKRQHGEERTFGKRWNQLQGPALCVFNNKVFSDDDLKGIQQLGEGGKHNSHGKTGKYGVGFNSVYHLTDCPSILTGDQLLCISDPNKKYIESASEKSPAGIGYRLPDRFKDMHKDVYKSFLPDMFPLKDGTMFRLPLRIGEMANSSKISQKSVTDEDMNKLCSVLSKDPEGLIMFLKNICKIEVHEISQESGEMKTIFMVQKSVPQTCTEKKDVFVKLQQNALKSTKVDKPQKVIYETTISTTRRTSHWLIAEQFGTLSKNADEFSSYDELPQAAIAALMNSNLSEFKGEAFCCLPLPGKTGLPVHINANFEVDSSRKNLWKEDGESQKTQWNELLKERVVAPLYADLLHHISLSVAKTKVQSAFVDGCFDKSYLCFWPVVSKNVGKDWHGMIHEVYRSIKERGLTVIPVKKTSVRVTHGHPIKECSFDWSDVRETGITNVPYLERENTFSVDKILDKLGMKLVPFSDKMQNIWRSFNSAGVKLKVVDSSAVRAFLKEKPLNDPIQTSEALPLPLHSTLIRDEKRCSILLNFCLRDLNSTTVTEKKSDVLDGVPLLLTRDKVLRVFNSESPKLITRHDSLFLDDMEKFADFAVNEGNKTTLQKYNLVKNLTVPCAAKYLKPLIQRHLQSCEVDSLSGVHVPNETMSQWLKSLWRFLESEIKQDAHSDDNETATISDVKELFSDCFILPVEFPKQKHLLQRMKDISSVMQFVKDRDISGVLFKLGFMKLDYRFFTEMNVNQQITLLLRNELMDVNDSSIVLDQICNQKHLEFFNLSNEEKSELQIFLQSGVSKAVNKKDFQKKFKSLPLFETISGDRVSIDGPHKVFVLQSYCLMSYPDLLKLPKCNSIFLKSTLDNLRLSESLEITKLTDVEYFVTFILPVVHDLTEEQKLNCFRFLLSLQLSLNCPSYKETIIPALKTVEWIRSSRGKLEMASYFFDKRVPLYEKMVPKEKFVPENFFKQFSELTQTKIPKLLRELGMKHEVSKKDIINFAHQLESEAKQSGHPQDLKEKSLLIFKTALEKDSNPSSKDKAVLQSIADIHFLFPVRIRKELCDYHKPFADVNTTVKIRGSLMLNAPKDQDLIWSSMPIINLPGGICYNELQMMEKAGAHQTPPAEYVAANMRNICLSPCKSDDVIKMRAQVFQSSYAYLQCHGFKAKTLADLPVVLVENDKELVKAQDTVLVLHCAKDFRPYLYGIPLNYVIYQEFFKILGVRENPTAAQFCRVLESVYTETREKQQLQANLLKTVKRAIQQLFYTIKEHKKQDNFIGITSLHLLAVDGKLHPSSTLYYNDTVFEAQRLEAALSEKFLLLEKLQNCHLGCDTYKHQQWLSLLPPSLQPNMLSRITGEKLVEGNMQLCELRDECEFRGWFEKHLSSIPFKHGLICLIRSHSRGEIQHQDADMLCQKTFGSMKIVCCENLETMLWLSNQPLENTASDTNVYVKQGKQGCSFYLKHNDDLSPKVISEVNHTLAKEIIALLGNKISPDHFAVLEQLLLCDTLKDVLKILAKHQIRDSAEGKSLIEPPAPGTEIPEEWHDWLDMDVLNNFEVDEYVGYQVGTDKYIYAIIVEELQGNGGQYSRRYKVNIGEDEPIEVSCLDVYQFKRGKKTDGEGTRTPPQNHCMELQLLVQTGSNPSSSSSSSTSGSSSARSFPASFDEIKREIDRSLEEIWTLPENQRSKAIRRLYLRFHPDKNPGFETLATEACKYLQKRNKDHCSGASPRRSSSNSRTRADFRTFYEQWNREARSHKQSRESNSRRYWTYNENIPKPNKKEAERWCRQARCDLKAAYKDTGGDSTEWCLFKVHQAVEKSLVAAGYKRDGRHLNSSCSISMLAAQVSSYSSQLRGVSLIVQELKLLGVDAKKTQYPNCYRTPNIPNGQFYTENGVQAINKASELLSMIEEYVS